MQEAWLVHIHILKKRLKNVLYIGKYNIGGIVGYSNARDIYNSIVNDTKIISTGTTVNNSYSVGGIVGYIIGSANVKGAQVNKTTITGQKDVGGIIGKRSVSSNTTTSNVIVSNSIIESKSTTGTSGGIIGTITNDTARYTRKTTLNKCFVIGNTTIKGKGIVGGIVGKIENKLSNKEAHISSCLIEAKIENAQVGGSSFGIGSNKSGLEPNETYKDNYVYKYSVMKIGNNEQYIDEKVDSYFVTNNYIVDRSELEKSKFYTEKLKLPEKTEYDYTTLKGNRDHKPSYPKLTSFSYFSNSSQVLVPLPEDPISSQSAEEQPLEIFSNELPTLSAYTIGVNKFNIDLSKTDENTKLTYSSENTEQNTIPITERTYTFEYNYQSDVTLTLENETESKTIVLTADEIKNKSSLQKDTVAYLEENKLFVNGQEIEGTFENLIDGKALATDGNIYDIDKSTYEENEQVELKLVETEPKAKQDYKENEIETYGTYSIVNGKIVDKIYTVSNGVLSITDGLLENVKSNKIIDNYNEKEIETILGTDGVLYDLKDEITYPKDFKNSNIESITVNTETDEKTVAVSYDDGSLVVFNYMTGKVTFEKEKTKTESESKLSLLDYILEKIGIGETKQEENLTNSVNITENDNISEQPNTQVEQNEEPLVTDYAETKQIEKKLQEKPIDSESGKNIDYVTTYNSATKSYEIYKEDALLNKETDDEVVESETKKIAANEELKKFYLESDVEKTKINDKGVYFIVGSIASVFVALIILRRYIISRRKQIILEKRRNRAKKNK